MGGGGGGGGGRGGGCNKENGVTLPWPPLSPCVYLFLLIRENVGFCFFPFCCLFVSFACVFGLAFALCLTHRQSQRLCWNLFDMVNSKGGCFAVKNRIIGIAL